MAITDSDHRITMAESFEEGSLVRDTERDRVGVVMGHYGPCIQLRKLTGGREWDANPERLEKLTAREELSVRNDARNTASRRGF
jgi:hypothetical protein